MRWGARSLFQQASYCSRNTRPGRRFRGTSCCSRLSVRRTVCSAVQTKTMDLVAGFFAVCILLFALIPVSEFFILTDEVLRGYCDPTIALRILMRTASPEKSPLQIPPCRGRPPVTYCQRLVLRICSSCTRDGSLRFFFGRSMGGGLRLIPVYGL